MRMLSAMNATNLILTYTEYVFTSSLPSIFILKRHHSDDLHSRAGSGSILGTLCGSANTPLLNIFHHSFDLLSSHQSFVVRWRTRACTPASLPDLTPLFVTPRHRIHALLAAKCGCKVLAVGQRANDAVPCGRMLVGAQAADRFLRPDVPGPGKTVCL